ncbi:MAG: hypothetical protein LJE68_17875 [Rhodobacter sp.]|nr:hypothetical protein [Rhodobacter sp.]
MLKKLFSALIALQMLGSAALAGSGGFSPDDVAGFEILPGWRTENGTHMTALRITLAPGWKTYWRAPGEAGIPPRFDWAGSSNLSGVVFHWPTPDVFHQNGMRAVGYKTELVLPIELTPIRKGQPITLRAAVELGVCQDICMPISVRVAADLPSSGRSDPRIRAAIDARPATSREAGMRSISCSVEPISDGLRLTARIDLPSVGRDEIAVFELPDQTIWVAEAETSRNGRTLTAVTDMVPPASGPFLLDRSQVRITVLAGHRAVDIWGCNG